MEQKRRSTKSKWFMGVVAIALVAGGYYLWNYTGLLAQLPAVNAQGTTTADTTTGAATTAEDAPALVTIQAAEIGRAHS